MASVLTWCLAGVAHEAVRALRATATRATLMVLQMMIQWVFVGP